MFTSALIAADASIDLGSALLGVPGKGARGKRRVKDAVNRVFTRYEDAGLVPRLAGLDESYVDYPELRVFERNHATIRAECMRLLELRDKLPDISQLAGGYTAGGIHTIRWKALMLKVGSVIPENAALCPETAALTASLPHVHTAFFSILEPHQYVTPHWGYFKGFVRYHLGVVVPNDNVDKKCWLRVNADLEDNRKHDKSLIERGQKHYWRNGRGFLFDDTCLHDASNESDQVRVILWLDVVRKLPPGLSLYARACIAAISLEPSIRRVREAATVRLRA